MGSIPSLFIVYRYYNTTGTFTVPSGGDGFYYFSVYCLQIWQHNQDVHSALWGRWILLLLYLLFYRYDSTTGTFTVPPGGDGFYYFYVYCLQIWQNNRNIHSASWWRWILLLRSIFCCEVLWNWSVWHKNQWRSVVHSFHRPTRPSFWWTGSL